MNSDKRGRSDDRDAAVDHLLRRTLQANGTSASPDMCLDAETLAAWADGVLPPGERAVVELHAAGCARCQALLAAMARTELMAAVPQRWWQRGRTLGWFIPLTAAATAAVLWFVVSPGPRSRPAEMARAATPAPPSLPDARTLDQLTPSPSVSSRLGKLDQEQDKKKEQKLPVRAKDREARDESAPLRKDRNAAAVSESVPPAARPAAPPAAAADSIRILGFQGIAPIDIVSPDPASRWRVSGAGGVVQHSTDGGSTWIDQSTGVAAQLTAGASPSASVCWLVGRGGVVLLSVDGRTWQRRPFPEPTDLMAVRAVDAKTATVTTADGRTVSTKDGGVTWNAPPLQESSAAPF